MVAGHLYADEHNGVLPPPALPNPDLPPEKRLSGLVLLLPYLGQRPSYAKPTDEWWKEWRLADEVTNAAQQLYQSIDLTKAWDDPVNLKAARTIVPVFLAPGAAPFRDERGYAASHFAFVRGYEGEENGAFPLEGKVGIPDIRDGTSNTLGLGQIHSHFGPWIAAGPSTSRHVYDPSADSEAPSFGSPHVGGGYFANCDAYTYFLDMAKTDPKTLRYITERADGHPIDNEKVASYRTASEWKASRDHPE